MSDVDEAFLESLTAEFAEIFNRKGDDGDHTYSVADQEQLRPVFLLKVATLVGWDGLTDANQEQIRLALGMMGAESTDSADQLAAHIDEYLRAVRVNLDLLDEVNAVFERHGMGLLQDRGMDAGDAFARLTAQEPRTAPHVDETAPEGSTLAGDLARKARGRIKL